MEQTVSSLLAGELERLGWVQADLARVLTWPVQTFSEVINGRRRIDAAMALDLQEATQIRAHDWLAVQAAQDLDDVRRDPKSGARSGRIRARAALEKKVPVRELIRRGVIDAADEAVQERQLRDLLEVPRLEDQPPFASGISARRSNLTAPLTRQQVAWVALARRAGREIEVAGFDASDFDEFAKGLPHQLHDPEDFVGLPHLFAEQGVRLVHVPAFPGGRLDGASLDLDGAPLVALSGRGKRLDRVLFTLLHECAHISLGHWGEGSVNVHESGIPGDQERERKVDALASTWVLPEPLERHGPLRAKDIPRLAQEYGVAEAVIIGQLQHAGLMPWGSQASRGLPQVEGALMAWS